MRKNLLFVAFILGGVSGLIAIVLSSTNEERRGRVDVTHETRQGQRQGEKFAENAFPAVMPDGREHAEVVTLGGELEKAGDMGRAGAVAEPGESSAVRADSLVSGETSTELHRVERTSFRSSESVLDRCRTRPAPTAESCEVMAKFVADLAREERDFEWAASAEAEIRAVVGARQDGTQIRALECKRTICAIETESPGTQHLTIFSQDEQEAAGIVDDGDFVLAWEDDPVRGRLTITEVFFTKRRK